MQLDEMKDHFFTLYGRRNRIFLPGLRDRIDFLNLAIGDLQETIRKNGTEKEKGIALARVVSRIFCIAEHFLDLPFVEAMAQKYPTACSYCHQSPCVCEERRSTHLSPEVLAAAQLQWSLREWCAHSATPVWGKE